MSIDTVNHADSACSGNNIVIWMLMRGLFAVANLVFIDTFVRGCANVCVCACHVMSSMPGARHSRWSSAGTKQYHLPAAGFHHRLRIFQRSLCREVSYALQQATNKGAELLTLVRYNYIISPKRRLCFHVCFSVCPFVCYRIAQKILIISLWNFMDWLNIIQGPVD